MGLNKLRYMKGERDEPGRSESVDHVRDAHSATSGPAPAEAAPEVQAAETARRGCKATTKAPAGQPAGTVGHTIGAMSSMLVDAVSHEPIVSKSKRDIPGQLLMF